MGFISSRIFFLFSRVKKYSIIIIIRAFNTHQRIRKMLTTQSPENSPPLYAVPTTHMMPEGFFTYHYAHLPIVFIEPAKEMPYMESMLDIETPMEEEIDVETVEESLPAADLLKQRLSRESVPESSSSLPSCSYTCLEPIRSSSLDQPMTEPKSPDTGDRSSEDDDLSRFTPRNSLREIEEHGQYDSSRDKDRKFKCQYCVKRFVRKEEKLRHERSHIQMPNLQSAFFTSRSSQRARRNALGCEKVQMRAVQQIVPPQRRIQPPLPTEDLQGQQGQEGTIKTRCTPKSTQLPKFKTSRIFIITICVCTLHIILKTFVLHDTIFHAGH